MKPLLHAELLKLATTRTFAALAGIAVATSLLITVLVGLLTRPAADSVLTDVFASDTTSLFILLLGVIGITGEWRHRTITGSLLAAPHRLRFLAAKAIAYAAAGIALSAMIAAAVTAAGYAILAIRGLPFPDFTDLLAQYGRNLLVAALLAAFGVCFGALLRNQVMALAGVLLLTFVIEPLLVAVRPEIGRYGPIGALATGASGLPPEGAGLEGVDVFNPFTSTLLLLIWIAILYAAAGALLRQRDLT